MCLYISHIRCCSTNCCCNTLCSTLQHTLCTNGSSIKGQNFSKVSSLSHVLYKMTVELTFENVYSGCRLWRVEESIANQRGGPPDVYEGAHTHTHIHTRAQTYAFLAHVLQSVIATDVGLQMSCTSSVAVCCNVLLCWRVENPLEIQRQGLLAICEGDDRFSEKSAV